MENLILCAVSVRILNHKYPIKFLKTSYNLNQYFLVSTKSLNLFSWIKVLDNFVGKKERELSLYIYIYIYIKI